jgi:hypothetical protein
MVSSLSQDCSPFVAGGCALHTPRIARSVKGIDPRYNARARCAIYNEKTASQKLGRSRLVEAPPPPSTIALVDARKPRTESERLTCVGLFYFIFFR